MKFIITGGGTGGHLVIAKVLQETLINRGHEAIFIGSTSGQDRAWFGEKSGFSHTYFLNTSGVVNKRGFAKIVSLWNILKAIFKSISIIKEHQIQGVISVGGFSAAPASFASLLLFKPLFIHEQNAAIGRLNGVLKSFAKAFFSSYEKNSPLKNYPVSSELFENARVREKLETIIFLGGSQGAKAVNDLAIRVAPLLKEKNIKIIHQCGANDYERVKSEYEKISLHVELFAFSKELPKFIKMADLAVSRSGASTLWELCASALPAFFIPYPYAAGDHQYHNAKFIVDQELGWCERESENLYEKFVEILDEDLHVKSQKLLNSIKPNGAVEIIKYIEKVI
jgi:UDP-N-acetylglucosamine--N-acetylmuramyl-(pentapeptide) pyrophosphoryl-undecaprenol N-acetylglucosamine transferase